jgi:hypothetical protein
MMSASNSIETMEKLRKSIREAQEWRSLIGSPYNGGGGGIGSVVNVTVSMEIYHQYTHGATNYHPIPCPALKAEMEAIVKGMGAKIIDEAIAALEAKLAVAAVLVLKEFEAIRADAEKIATEAKE